MADTQDIFFRKLQARNRASRAGDYMSMAGKLGEAAFGENDYSGEKGDMTLAMDTGYDATKQVVGQLGPWGKMAAGIMDINAGLGNAFGQTDKTNKIDAAFDSKFTPFFLKWINSSGAKTVRSGLSAQEDDRLKAFGQGAYGDTGFDMIGKKVGRFAKKYYNRYQNKVNQYTNSMLAMADQAELQGIRSQGMASQNAQNYYQEISGGMDQVERGSKGMKITKSQIERFRNVRSKVQQFKNGKPLKVKSDKSYYDPETNTIYYTDKESLKHEKVHANPRKYEGLFEYLTPYYENLDDNRIQELGGDLEYVKRFDNDPGVFYNPEELVARVVAGHSRIKKARFFSPEFFAKLRQNEDQYGDNIRDLLHMYNDKNLSKIFRYFTRQSGGGGSSGEVLYFDPTGEFAGGQAVRSTGYDEQGNQTYETLYGDTFLNPESELEKYKNGGKTTPVFKKGGHLSRQMNVIPEGALHAHKNHMELADEGEITHKGIPVIDNDGNQQAEIEREEIIFNKDTTDKIEKWYKEFFDEESKSDKDELSIKCGKFLVNEILFNTEDRVGLIEKLQNNGD